MGYGAGVGAWVGYNAQVTNPGGLGFRRGPLGGGFSSGVGHSWRTSVASSHWLVG
ncbi:hypothetical protein Hanom_Chr07g00646111 [Helianthus anomalus]